MVANDIDLIQKLMIHKNKKATIYLLSSDTRRQDNDFYHTIFRWYLYDSI